MNDFSSLSLYACFQSTQNLVYRMHWFSLIFRENLHCKGLTCTNCHGTFYLPRRRIFREHLSSPSTLDNDFYAIVRVSSLMLDMYNKSISSTLTSIHYCKNFVSITFVCIDSKLVSFPFISMCSIDLLLCIGSILQENLIIKSLSEASQKFCLCQKWGSILLSIMSRNRWILLLIQSIINYQVERGVLRAVFLKVALLLEQRSSCFFVLPIEHFFKMGRSTLCSMFGNSKDDRTDYDLKNYSFRVSNWMMKKSLFGLWFRNHNWSSRLGKSIHSNDSIGCLDIQKS